MKTPAANPTDPTTGTAPVSANAQPSQITMADTLGGTASANPDTVADVGGQFERSNASDAFSTSSGSGSAVDLTPLAPMDDLNDDGLAAFGPATNASNASSATYYDNVSLRESPGAFLQRLRDFDEARPSFVGEHALTFGTGIALLLLATGRGPVLRAVAAAAGAGLLVRSLVGRDGIAGLRG